MYEHQTTIEYNGDKKFSVGDAMYKVVADDSKAYNSVCRVCHGERILTVNGVTFQCPCCENEETAVIINHFSVSEYFVTQVAEKMQVAVNNDTIPQTVYDTNNIVISVQLSAKDGSFSFSENITFDKETGFINGTDNWFDRKEAAEEAMRLSNASEINKLLIYNKEHGTDFPVPNFEKKEG